jgi:hypothetical protein
VDRYFFATPASLGPSERAFALKLYGSILNPTGPALRDLAGR